MSKAVSMTELAKIFNVSKVTISNALNDKEGVSPQLKEEIKKKAAELGWRLNSAARNLKTSKSYNIGILIAERYIGNTESYYLGIYGKLSSKFASLGYSCILETINYEKEKKLELPLMYRDSKVDAIMIIGQLNTEYLKMFENINIPILFLDFYNFNINVDSISMDNYTLGYLLTDHLISNGHRNIGFVGNIHSTTSIQDRFLGFYRALLENKITLDYDYVISDRNELGKTIDLSIKKIPTEFVCNNDHVAFTLIKKLKQSGIKVPEDVSVVAFDNTIFSTISEPTITTVDNNVDNIVELASKVILKKLSCNKIYGRVLSQGEIVERNSVKKIC